jgi:hypothetical protein
MKCLHCRGPMPPRPAARHGYCCSVRCYESRCADLRADAEAAAREHDRIDCVRYRGCLNDAARRPRSRCVCTPGCADYVPREPERASVSLQSIDPRTLPVPT